MTKRHRQTLAAAIALSLGITAAGAAQAGISPQGPSRQGISPQGISPQGISPQGISPQGIAMDGVALSTLLFLDGQTISNPWIQGSDLRALKLQSGQWVTIMGSALVGATLEADIFYQDGATTASQHVTLFIADVKADTSTNTMVCDPQNPGLTACSRNYHQNGDVMLYKLAYWVGDLEDAPTIGWLCGGDQHAMLLKGWWDEDGEWVNDPSRITVSCTDGVLAKCSRSWGYKPWRTMYDKYGNPQVMRPYHQACTRAARADYSGLGYSMTVTGTPIDIFDNGGYNLPASSSTLASLGYQPDMRFEAVFTSNKKVGSIKPDYWGAWMSGPRHSEMPQWEAMYDYPDIDWDGESPKLGFSATTPPSSWQSLLDQRYGQYGAELAVYNPVWSATGSAAAAGSTSESFNHASPSCVSNSKAPDRAHRWTAPQSGTYRLTTAGSSFDTVLYAYSNQSQVACNDDYGGLQSAVNVTVTAGQELTIFVDGYGSNKGQYTLNITKL
jgi:hypothetical protein